MPMTIGQVASGAGVNIQTARYYERRGLLPRAPRTASGYRQYEADTIARLKFIKRAQELGFSLDDITDLPDLRVDPDGACAAVEAKAKEQIATVERKLRELQSMKDALQELVDACEAREPTGECPMLVALEDPGRSADGSR